MERGFNSDIACFASCFIAGSYVNNTVGINIKSNLNLRCSSLCRRNAVQMETSNCFVVGGHGAFTLQYVNFYGWLIVGCR